LSNKRRKSTLRAGLPPGTITHVGERKTEKAKVTVIDYNSEELIEKVVDTVEESFDFIERPSVTWINIDGIDQVDVIEKVGKRFNIDQLVLEDIVNTTQRPKIEDYSDYIFVTVKMIRPVEGKIDISVEHISLILSKNCVITFQETEGDVFDVIRDRLKIETSRIRGTGADYLAYALIDTIVDNYFIVLEVVSDKSEELEKETLDNIEPETLREIYKLKREVILLRKITWPLRDIVSYLERDETSLIDHSTHKFLRDLHDHVIQVSDSVETVREMLTGLQESHISVASHRMNEVMKVLTIIATIFIPLTFIAGIYGMNFEVMPPTKWPWGYPLILGLMAAIGIFMVMVFKKNKWF
jgi:magnesium transporter